MNTNAEPATLTKFLHPGHGAGFFVSAPRALLFFSDAGGWYTVLGLVADR
ncbi:MAG: hypothetical protein GY792_18460 [Gammaproteobacteria bacterium]|nr:hypothetical protein [Gammaproteobacteria bacterium]